MAVQDDFQNFQDDQRVFFDRLITEDWDSYDSRDWDTTRRFEVEKLFSMVQPSVVLDVGCGVGFHDAVMANYDFVERVDAIDYSEQSVIKAEEVFPHLKVKRSVQDFFSLDQSELYDLVVSFQVFEHSSSPQEFMDRCFDACNRGGYCAVFTPNRIRLSNRLRTLRRQKPVLCDPQHFKEYTRKELELFGSAAGFRPAGWFGYGVSGLKSLGKMSHLSRVEMGNKLPWIADGICVVLRKP